MQNNWKTRKRSPLKRAFLRRLGQALDATSRSAAPKSPKPVLQLLQGLAQSEGRFPSPDPSLEESLRNRIAQALRGSLLAAMLLSLSVVAPTPSLAQSPLNATNLLRPDFWDTDGTIHAMAVTNGVLYLGGSFSYLSPTGGKAGAIDRYTGALNRQFPTIHGPAVHTLIEDGSGGWFIGGEFVAVGNLSLTNLARIRSDYSVDPNFHPSLDGAVRTLVILGNRLFLGGDFTAVGGEARSRLAALTIPTGEPEEWNPGADDSVASLIVVGNILYAGGYFTTVGGEPRNHIAALDVVTGNVSAWNPDADGWVLTLGWSEDRLFAGGFFNRIGGQLRNGLAALNPDLNANNATDWNPHPEGGKVTVLRLACQTVYAGGYFTHVSGVPRNRLAAIDSHSGFPTTWDATLDPGSSDTRPSSILALEISGDTLYLGGEFNALGELPRRDLAALSLTTGQVLPWAPDPGGGVSALSVSGRTVLAGFLKPPGGVQRQNLAALDTLTGRVTDWNPTADGPVYALSVSGDTVYAGGGFSAVNGVPRDRLVALDAATGEVRSNWAPTADDTVFALTAAQSTLYIGGRFNQVNGTNRQRIAAVDSLTGSLLDNWAASADSTVYALLASEDALYLGGNFIAVNGQTRRRLAALNAATGELRPWNPDADQRVRSLAWSGTTLYAGGDFTLVGGLIRNHLAALNLATGQPTSWAPSADAEVLALAVSANEIYLAGTFLKLNGQPRLGCAAIDLTGTLLDWDPGNSTANRVHALALSETALYLGGTGDLRFRSSPSTHSLGAFGKTGAPTLAQPLPDQTLELGQTITFEVDAAGLGPLFYQWRFDETNLPGATNRTLIITNAAPDDTGRYSIVITNALGAITASASLLVLEGVSILTQPLSQTAAPGGTITLVVEAEGSPAPRYQWRLNGVNIPGAVFPTLTLNNVGPEDGGSYQVVVANRVGAVSSQIATLVVSSPALPFADNLSEAGTIMGTIGGGSGDSGGATKEAGEPDHAGKPGGASLWLRWIAPDNGIATFDTRGSGFDTLLAIYALTNLDQLVRLASDEDRGGFLTSRASFNASAGVQYLIAIDGLAGASGNIVLGWGLDTTVVDVPRITSHPISQSVSLGATALFSVEAASPTPVTYQWFLGCSIIPDATNQTLMVLNVQQSNVGNYRVVAMRDSERAVESDPAALEIGPEPTAVSFDKLEDALARYSTQFGFSAGVGGAAPSGFILVGFGSIVSQTFDTSENTTSLREPNHCGTAGGASAWLVFQAQHDGVVQVDTIGSSFDTVLAIYHPTNLSNLGSAIVACDNDGAPDGLHSLLQFQAVGGAPYLAVVDGVNGAKGLAQIRWTLGLPPQLDPAQSNPLELLVRRGANLSLPVHLLAGDPPPFFQWRLNGLNLTGVTNDTLILDDFQIAQAGIYSVVIWNFAGALTHPVAIIQIEGLPRVSNIHRMSNGQLQGEILGWPGDAFLLQASGDLFDWTDLLTNQIPAGPFEFVDPDAASHSRRFYRARLWP